MNYIDLYFGVNVLENTKLSLGIQNVFDETPRSSATAWAPPRITVVTPSRASMTRSARIYTLGVNVTF